MTMPVNAIGIMDMLRDKTSDRGPDLLVTGAQGHMPFVGRGAGTRYVFRHMSVPVLMSS